jgi:hypothetical protein
LDVVTKYYRLGGLSNKHLFLTGLDGGKSKIKVLAGLVYDEGSLPGLQTDAFLFCPFMAEREREYVS